METLIDNCGHFRLFLHPGAVLLGESGIVVSFRLVERYKQQAPSSGHVIIEFEDENGEKVDFHAWCACRPRWPLGYVLINAKEWTFWSSDPSYGRRGGLPSSQRVNETVRFYQLRLTVSSSGKSHGLDIKVYAEQPQSTTG